jgi:IS30 family transposase
MGGRRHTKQELQQIQALVDQGLTSREIAEQLGRSEAAIRNLRHREGMLRQAQDETKSLFQQRDQLRDEVNTKLTVYLQDHILSYLILVLLKIFRVIQRKFLMSGSRNWTLGESQTAMYFLHMKKW